MVTGLRNMTYEQRLKVLVLATFETRMLRADLIQVCKTLHNIAVDNRRGQLFNRVFTNPA